MKTIAQQLNVTEFPFVIKDKNGNQIYFENSNGAWAKYEYDSNGNRIYCETSPYLLRNIKGYIQDNRPKPCEGKLVEIEGIKYKLTAL